MNWSARPFLRIFIFLIPGILVAYWVPFVGELRLNLLLISLAVLLLTGYIIYKLSFSWSRRWMPGIILGFSIFITGMLLVILKQANPPEIRVANFETYISRVIEEPVETDVTVRTVVDINQVVSSDTVHIAPGRTMAFFRKDSLSVHLEYGDIIVFKGKLTTPEGPKNPGEFNYAEFLALNNVHYIVFISSDNWSLVGTTSNTLISLAIKARKYLLNVINNNGIEGDDYAVAAAILLGYDQLLEPELEQNFVTAGAMHILCVSGLHVGIIYLVLNFLLGFLSRNKFQKIVKVVLLLTMIWFYALLTGFSPSVQRASLMITLFIVATLSSKQKDVYNTLAASAVILIFIDPFIIFNVGFQLSYTAVLGILMFYKPIAGLFYIKNPVARKVWEIVAVSIAAQLGTFPLAAHYFHFFPSYFWLTNIFIFPLSFAIVGTGMLLMALSWVPVVSGWVGMLLSGFVFVLNLIVESVSFLPHHGIHDLYFPRFKVLLVYLLILMLIPLVFNKQIKLLFPALLVLLFVLLFQTEHSYRILNQERVAVYSVNQHSAIDFIRQNKHVLLVDSALLEEDHKLEYHLSNCRINWGLAKNSESIEDRYEKTDLNLFYDGQFGAFGDLTFMRINDKIPYGNKQALAVDFVIISGKRRIDIEALAEAVTFEYLVIDSSVPYWKQKKVKEQAAEMRFKCFNVSEQGAFILEN
ncbi:MAG: ComEC family competence protein [Bacteroidetes bacterium]|nr:ComEC family competence protein [Bacteroidota bacterium]